MARRGRRCCGVGLLGWLLVFGSSVGEGQKIAIIGEGISGSFTAKYLSDYDVDCKADSITIFEAVPLDGPVQVDSSLSSSSNVDGPTTTDADDDYFQGSRVNSVVLSDKHGMNIEIGASIGHVNFHLVLEMIHNDPTLDLGPPFTTGLDTIPPEGRSMGIYNGHQDWAFRTYPTVWKWLNKVLLLLRYNWDLWNMSRLVSQAIDQFKLLPQLLNSTDPDTFFESPMALWDRLGLLPATQLSLSQLLDQAHIRDHVPWWKQWLLGWTQGCLRNELITAINLVNYNQNNNQVNALVGLGSFAASSGNLFSIPGGNHAVIRSAVRQARQIRSRRSCFGQVQQQAQTVTHVIGLLHGQGLELFAGPTVSLGVFDVVILAAPLHQCRIQFHVQSQFDDSILQPMPLGGLIANHDDQQQETAAASSQREPPPPSDHDGHDAFPAFLPLAAQRPYTQVVTTVVSGGQLDGHVLGLSKTDAPPRSILVTESGKAALYNITAITRIHSEAGVYKLFSNDILNETVKTRLFGNQVQTEYVKGTFLLSALKIMVHPIVSCSFADTLNSVLHYSPYCVVLLC